MSFHPLRYVLLLVLLTGSLGLMAQNEAVIRTKQRILEKGTTDTMYIRLNLEIADEYIFNNPDTCRHYASRALQRAVEIKDTLQSAVASNYMGICHYSQGRYLTALEFYQKSQQLYRSINDLEGVAKVTNNIGNVYNILSEQGKAISSFREAYDQNISLGKYENAGSNLFNIVGCFLQLEDLVNARTTMRELEELHEKYPGTVDPASIKADLYLQENKPDSALLCIDRALAISREESDAYFEGSLLISQATAYIKKKTFYEAEISLSQALTVIRRSGFDDLLLSYYQTLGELRAGQGLHSQAYDAQRRYTELKDSLDKVNNFNRVSELNAKYEAEKREAEIARQTEEIRSRSSQMWLAVIIGSAALILAAVIMFNLIRKRKMNLILRAQNQEIKSQRQKIISSIDYAKRIQRSIMPPAAPLAEVFDEHFLFLKPRDIVSGDFYWYRRIEGRLYFAVIDCTGHGVPGAFMSLIANNKLNKVIVERGEREPSQVLFELHREIRALLHQDQGTHNAQDGMDMSLVVVDLDQRKIQFAGANNSICVVSGGELQEIKANPFSIGGSILTQKYGDEINPFQTSEINFHQGDYLFMYTDGMLDQLGGQDNRKFNKSRFREILNSTIRSGLKSATEQLENILLDWKRSRPQTDDILIFGAKLR